MRWGQGQTLSVGKVALLSLNRLGQLLSGLPTPVQLHHCLVNLMMLALAPYLPGPKQVEKEGSVKQRGHRQADHGSQVGGSPERWLEYRFTIPGFLEA